MTRGRSDVSTTVSHHAHGTTWRRIVGLRFGAHARACAQPDARHACGEQCDGATSPEAIAALLRVEMGIPEAEAVVDLTLTQLARLHLLELPVEPRGDRSAPTRRWLLSRGLAAAMLPAIYSIVAPSPVAGSRCQRLVRRRLLSRATCRPSRAAGRDDADGDRAGCAGRDWGSAGGLGGSVTATLTVVPGAISECLRRRPGRDRVRPGRSAASMGAGLAAQAVPHSAAAERGASRTFAAASGRY